MKYDSQLIFLICWLFCENIIVVSPESYIIYKVSLLYFIVVGCNMELVYSSCQDISHLYSVGWNLSEACGCVSELFPLLSYRCIWCSLLHIISRRGNFWWSYLEDTVHWWFLIWQCFIGFYYNAGYFDPIEHCICTWWSCTLKTLLGLSGHVVHDSVNLPISSYSFKLLECAGDDFMSVNFSRLY